MNLKTKRKNHKIFVLLSMLADELDGQDLNENAQDILDLSKTLQSKLDPLVDDVFSHSKLVNKTTYIQDMHNKIETIIRKNYKTDEGVC